MKTQTGKTQTGKRQVASAILIGSLFTTTALLVYAAMLSFQTALDATNQIPPPEAMKPLNQNDATLTRTTAEAIRYRHGNVKTIDVSVSREDFSDFKGHLNNIAAEQGWLLHGPSKTHVYLTIPQDQVHKLESMEQGGAEWILTHKTDNKITAPQPNESQPNESQPNESQPNESMVNVKLNLAPPLVPSTLLLVVTVTCIIAIATFVIALIKASALVKELSKPTVHQQP